MFSCYKYACCYHLFATLARVSVMYTAMQEYQSNDISKFIVKTKKPYPLDMVRNRGSADKTHGPLIPVVARMWRSRATASSRIFQESLEGEREVREGRGLAPSRGPPQNHALWAWFFIEPRFYALSRSL